MRVFTKKHPDPSRESAVDRAGHGQRQRLETLQGDVPERRPERPAASNDSLLRLVQARSLGLVDPCTPRLHLHAAFLHSLSLDGLLEGHEGCVNRLAWNASSTLLASGSDDCTVRLWDFTREKRPLRLTLNTGHSANIFAVGFLRSDASVVSAGMDMDVRVCDVEAAQCTDVYHCHPNRVKELCVDPGNDCVFLTSGEDGSCRQFDLRAPHRCTASERRRRGHPFLGQSSSASPCGNAIVANSALPLKCVDINPVQPHFFLLSADDQFIRVYDRRMCRTGTVDTAYAPCYSRHAAGHLKRSHHSTFSQWDESGTQIVASYSGEQVYVYDFNTDDDDAYTRYSTAMELKEEEEEQQHDAGRRGDEEIRDDPTATSDPASMIIDDGQRQQPTALDSATSAAWERAFPSHFSPSATGRGKDSTATAAPLSSSMSAALLAEVDRLKDLGNAAFHAKDYSLSISYYNEALLLRSPLPPSTVSLVLSNRAAAYLKRAFAGDLPIALSDAMHAFRLDRTNLKALYRAVQGHKEMKRWGRGIKLGLYALERVRGDSSGWEGERELRALVEEMQKERAKQKREEGKREERSGGDQSKTARRQQKEERKRKEEERKQRRTKRSSHKEREEKHSAAGSAGASTTFALGGPPSGSGAVHRDGKRKMANLRTESEEEVRAMETEVTSEENDDKRRRVNHSRAARADDRKEPTKEAAKGGGRERIREEKERECKDEKAAEAVSGGADDPGAGHVWHELQDMSESDFEELIMDTVNLTQRQWADKYGEDTDDDDPANAGPFWVRQHDDDDEDEDEDEEDEDDDMDDENAEDEDDDSDDDVEDDEDDDEMDSDDIGEEAVHNPPSPSRRPRARQPDDEHETETSSLSDAPLLSAAAPAPPTSTSAAAPPPASAAPHPPHTTRTRRSFVQRYVGHANRQTDIKESTFWGPYILSGSDDGHVFMWDRRTARLLCVVRASDQIINCVRGHSSLPLVVTSGIDNEIHVWAVKETDAEEREAVGARQSERKEGGEAHEGRVEREQFSRLVEANQRGDEDGGGWISAPMFAHWLAQAMQHGRVHLSRNALRRMAGQDEEAQEDEEEEES